MKWINLHNIERVVFQILISVVVAYIFVEIVELVYQFGHALAVGGRTDERLMISKSQLQLVLPAFFNILIALEMINALTTYIKHHEVNALNILLIGIIALGRKLITLDFSSSSAMTNLGLAALILALSGGYYLIRRSERTCKQE